MLFEILPKGQKGDGSYNNFFILPKTELEFIFTDYASVKKEIQLVNKGKIMGE